MGSRGRALDGASAPDSARLGSAPRRRPASSRLGPLQSPEMEPGRAVVVKAPFGGRVGSQAADWETDFPGCTAQGGSFVSEGPFAVGPVLGSLSASAVPGCAVCGGGQAPAGEIGATQCNGSRKLDGCSDEALKKETASRECPAGERGVLLGGFWFNTDSFSLFLQPLRPQLWVRGPRRLVWGKSHTG